MLVMLKFAVPKKGSFQRLQVWVGIFVASPGIAIFETISYRLKGEVFVSSKFLVEQEDECK